MSLTNVSFFMLLRTSFCTQVSNWKDGVVCLFVCLFVMLRPEIGGSVGASNSLAKAVNAKKGMDQQDCLRKYRFKMDCIEDDVSLAIQLEEDYDPLEYQTNQQMRLKKRDQQWRPSKVDQPEEPKRVQVPGSWSDRNLVSLGDLEYLPFHVGVENESQMAYDKVVSSHYIALLKYGLNPDGFCRNTMSHRKCRCHFVLAHIVDRAV